MSWYRTGKASIYKGTREMTGYGTQWADNKHSINRGHIVLLPGSGTVQLYEIETVNSDSSITLTTDFTGETVSQGDYAIINTLTSTVPDFARRLAAQLQYNQELFDSIAEWVKSEEADVVIILPDGSEVKMPSLTSMRNDIAASSKLNAAVDSIEQPTSTVIWKGDGLFKEVGVGYPRDGSSPASRFGYHSKDSATPRLYMTDGKKSATLQFNMADGMVATREWVSEAVNRDNNANWVGNPNKTMRWGAHNDYLYAKQDSKSYPTLLIEKNDNITMNGKLDLKSTGNYTSFTMGKGDNTGVLFQVSPYKEVNDDSAFMSIVEKDSSNVNKSSFNFPREGSARTAASRQWVNLMLKSNENSTWTIAKNGWFAEVTSSGKFRVGNNDGTDSFIITPKERADFSGELFCIGNASVWNKQKNARIALAVVDDKMYFSKYHSGTWKGETIIPDGDGTMATREWIYSSTGWGVGSDWGTHMFSHTALSLPTGTYRYDGNTLNKPSTSVGFGAAIVTRYSADISHHLYINNYGSSVLAVKRQNGSSHENYYVLTSNNYTVDSNGFYKKASPIVKVFYDGRFETNEESEGASVERLEEGVYKISGVLGFHSDAAWGGAEGGIEVPVDNNKQPVIWVDYEVEKDGTIIVKTFHRVYKDSPVFAQNNKEGYSDGDPIDIPDGRFLSVRVEMPEDSVFNLREKKNKEESIKAEALSKARERESALEKIDSTINDVYNNGTEEQLKLPFFEEKEV